MLPVFAGAADAPPGKPVHHVPAPAAKTTASASPKTASPKTVVGKPVAGKPLTGKPAVATAKPTPAKAAEPPPPAAAVIPAESPKGSNTGLPLPRFASLKTDDVNLRTGPGLRYPIEWVYRRRDLPVQIEREFEVWRLVADQEGVKGWVHQATLSGRRSFVVAGGEQTVRSAPQDGAAPVARLKPGVIGRLRACDASAPWCEVQVGDYHGWLKRDAFWGAYPGEAIQ